MQRSVGFEVIYHRGVGYRFVDVGLLDGKKPSVVLLRGSDILILPLVFPIDMRKTKPIVVPNARSVRCLDIDDDERDEILILGPYGVGVIKNGRLQRKPLVLFPEETISMATVEYRNRKLVAISTQNHIYIVDGAGNTIYSTYAYRRYLTNIGDKLCVVLYRKYPVAIEHVLSFRSGSLSTVNLLDFDSDILVGDIDDDDEIEVLIKRASEGGDGDIYNVVDFFGGFHGSYRYTTTYLSEGERKPQKTSLATDRSLSTIVGIDRVSRSIYPIQTNLLDDLYLSSLFGRFMRVLWIKKVSDIWIAAVLVGGFYGSAVMIVSSNGEILFLSPREPPKLNYAHVEAGGRHNILHVSETEIRPLFLDRKVVSVEIKLRRKHGLVLDGDRLCTFRVNNSNVVWDTKLKCPVLRYCKYSELKVKAIKFGDELEYVVILGDEIMVLEKKPRARRSVGNILLDLAVGVLDESVAEKTINKYLELCLAFSSVSPIYSEFLWRRALKEENMRRIILRVLLDTDPDFLLRNINQLSVDDYRWLGGIVLEQNPHVFLTMYLLRREVFEEDTLYRLLERLDASGNIYISGKIADELGIRKHIKKLVGFEEIHVEIDEKRYSMPLLERLEGDLWRALEERDFGRVVLLLDFLHSTGQFKIIDRIVDSNDTVSRIYDYMLRDYVAFGHYFHLKFSADRPDERKIIREMESNNMLDAIYQLINNGRKKVDLYPDEGLEFLMMMHRKKRLDISRIKHIVDDFDVLARVYRALQVGDGRNIDSMEPLGFMGKPDNEIPKEILDMIDLEKYPFLLASMNPLAAYRVLRRGG